jgi:hypothetical protein
MKFERWFFGLVLICSFVACDNNDCKTLNEDIKGSWSVVNGYGTIAGISQIYPKGQITWVVDNSNVKIENNFTGDNNFSMPTGLYPYDATSSIEGGQIIFKDITYRYIAGKDTIYLNDNLADGIRLILIR